MVMGGGEGAESPSRHGANAFPDILVLNVKDRNWPNRSTMTSCWSQSLSRLCLLVMAYAKVRYPLPARSLPSSPE